MIKIIPSSQRHFGDHGWLKARWHFSFSEYRDPNNMNFGPLRVFNDDIILGGGGFDPHPHRDMEIITYVIEGRLEHEDSLGNKGIIEPGEIQVMSAGKGIVHAERNPSKTEPLHLLQLWIFPRTRGRTPRWEQKQFSADQRRSRLLPVVSDGSIESTLRIDQDAAIFVASLGAGETVGRPIAAGRLAYLFVIEGEIRLNGMTLQTGDQARISDELSLDIAASKPAELILLDLPPA